MANNAVSFVAGMKNEKQAATHCSDASYDIDGAGTEILIIEIGSERHSVDPTDARKRMALARGYRP